MVHVVYYNATIQESHMATRKTPTTPADPPPTPALGDLIDKMASLKTQKAEHDSSATALGREIEALEQQIIDVLDEQKTTKGSSKTATVSIAESVQPNVENWDAVFEFIRKNRMFHLVQRRMSAPAWRELESLGKKVPGVVPFTKRSLSFTKAR